MNKKKLTIYIIVAAAVLIAAVKMVLMFSHQDIDTVVARTKGASDAKVKVIEFIDFQCPACAHGAKFLHEYMAGHQGIELQVKYFPLVRTHSHAMQAAVYSECAARQNKFWEFHGLLMSQQAQWSPLINAETIFGNIAREAGLDAARLSECVKSDAAAQVVKDDQSLGQSLGVQSTPTYFVNNKMAVGVKSLMDELDIYFPKK